MPLILLKTEKNVIYGIYIEKLYGNMKKLFSTKCVLTSKKVKNGYFVQFQRKKMYIVFLFLFLIKTLKSIENDKKVTFGVKSYFFL